ncbi:MAG: hypothetical protein IJH81_02725, partial [Lachnospiraceae bacterium]|nr:hypothetical protein [Lachnospiraceae bacterium]
CYLDDWIQLTIKTVIVVSTEWGFTLKILSIKWGGPKISVSILQGTVYSQSLPTVKTVKILGKKNG